MQIQKAQGHNGILGASIGQKSGHLSTQSRKYKSYRAMLQNGLLTPDKKPGRKSKNKSGKKEGRKRRREDNTNTLCMAGLTFRQQLELIDTYKKMKQELGGDVNPLLAAMRKHFGEDRFNQDYPTKNLKKGAKNRLKIILDDEVRLRYAFCCGLGDDKRWTKGGLAHNPMEEDIAKQLNRLRNNGVKITARIIVNVALSISSAAGIVCQWTRDCEDLITLVKADFQIGKSIVYIIADVIENDRKLRQHFDLN